MTQHQVWDFYWQVLQPLEKQIGEEALLEELELDIPPLDEKIQAMARRYQDGLVQRQRILQMKDNERALFLKGHSGDAADNERFSD